MRLRHRRLLGMLAAALAGAVVFAVGAGAILRRELRQRAMDRIETEAGYVARALEWLEPANDLATFATRTAGALGVRVTLVAADGRVLADSSVDDRRITSLDNHLERPEIQAARLAGSGRAIRDSDTTGVRSFYAVRVAPAGGPVRYVRLALPLSELDRAAAAPLTALVAVVAATMIVLVGVGYGALRRLSRPVEQLADAVARSADSSGAEPIPASYGAGTELERLTGSVRRMQLALLEKIAEQERERQVLASVVAGMHEGLLLVGPDRRVRLVNTAARAILDLRFDPEGCLLEEVVRHPAVVHDVTAALGGASPDPAVLQLPGSDRSFQLRAVPLEGAARSGAPGALVLFFDVTRLESLERVRQDFVANVSHELRTPLTSIKAFVENLLDGGLEDGANARSFLEIVRRHADRMGALIEDLTDLSLIETGAVLLEKRPVDAAEVVREVLEQLAPLAAARQVGLRTELPAPFLVHADRRRLEQMLSNLVDNAIKFNRPEGSVTVRGTHERSGTTIEVADTGVGIPADSLEKVFQRFYQIQRSRSRELGGTGLGLSIVKHLMRLHGGRVRVESEFGTGSLFALEFPPQPASTAAPSIASTG